MRLLLGLALLLAGCSSDGVPPGPTNGPTLDGGADAASVDGGSDAGPLTCDAARARLVAQCGFGEQWLAGLSCSRNPTCVLACFDLVKRCDDVGCAFCATCDCAGTTPFARCVLACP